MSIVSHIWISQDEAFNNETKAMNWLTDFHGRLGKTERLGRDSPIIPSSIQKTKDGAYFVYDYKILYVRKVHLTTN